MNIKVASERTGLTKKAIKYYEIEGLIIPSKNSENNYREYSESDIVKLNLIGALRMLDIPIAEIKKVIEGNKSMHRIMEESLQRIDNDIENLKTSRLIISNLLEKNSQDYYGSGDNIKKLRESLELSMEERKEFISNKLRRIFPGKYGEAFILNYEPFLDIIIDDEDKKEIWIKLIETLDDFDDISETEEGKSLMNKYNSIDIGEYTDSLKKIRTQNTYNIINWNEEYVQTHIKSAVEYWKKLLNNSSERESFKKVTAPIIKNMTSTFGEVHKEFGKYLELLNKDFKLYVDNTQRLAVESHKQFEKETGLSLKEEITKLLEK